MIGSNHISVQGRLIRDEAYRIQQSRWGHEIIQGKTYAKL